MATIPPINVGALKVTFPANLPRNEKDLICMLLAGRLKDLWNGKLICAQLALNDLTKDISSAILKAVKDGASAEVLGALGDLKSSLVKLGGSLANFKQASGYDQILAGVNNALGQISNVFSLGGLCPSPVQAPKIPDVLGTLNANLFGQAGDIVNALTQASNPKVCFGGGPKGFGIDWSQVSGSLATLKSTIEAIKNNPAGYVSTLNAFKANLDNQAKRLNAELKRLEADLTDPLGINNKKNTVSNIVRTKEISDDYTVKDKNGVEYRNPSSMLTTGEIDSILKRYGSSYTDPVSYKTVPVYDYCGNISGYKREAVSGDPDYLGWDTVNTDLNKNTPTALAESTFLDYDYTLAEENGTIVIYDDAGNVTSVIKLERGKHYRIGFKLQTKTLQFLKANSVPWTRGIKALKEPDYGIGLESVIPDLDPSFSYSRSTVEIDWAVLIEIPNNADSTTPDKLMWKTADGLTGDILVSGITELPAEDKTYDLSMAVRKSWLMLKHVNELLNVPGQTGRLINEQRVKNRRYTAYVDLKMPSGFRYVSNPAMLPNLEYVTPVYVERDPSNPIINPNELEDPFVIPNLGSGNWKDNGYTIIRDTETLDEAGDIIDNNWIAQWWVKLINPADPLDIRYLTLKKYVTDSAGFEVNQILIYLTKNPDTPEIGFELIASLLFDESAVFLNDTKLPSTNRNDYKITIFNSGKLNNNEELKIEKPENDPSLLRINLSENRQGVAVPTNEFVYTSDIKVNPHDQLRNYLDVDAVTDTVDLIREEQTYIQINGGADLKLILDIKYNGRIA